MKAHVLAATAAIALLTAGAGLAAAQSTAMAPSPAPATLGPADNRQEGYLPRGVLDGKAILGPPPAPESAHGRADRTLFDETRALEGSDRWKAAIQDNDLWNGGALKRYSCALGVELDETQTPVTWKLLHKIEVDVRTVGTPAKDFYDRKRPLIGNDKPLCVPREDWMRTNASYPSGHSMVAWAWSLILTEAAPLKADALLKVGREGGESRMICGVHFISDVEAGRTLGSAMVARLHAEPAFKADLKKARRELAKAKRPAAGCS